METKYAITYGRLEDGMVQGLNTLFITGHEKVRDIANIFIHVIPDDLVSYEEDIREWDGKSRLLITHQDDDSFYFSVVPVPIGEGDDTTFQVFMEEFDRG